MMNDSIKKIYQRLKSDAGTTLVENLIALALLTAVVVPTGLLFAKLASNQSAVDLDTAALLCRHTIEYTIATEDFESNQWKKIIHKKRWVIVRDVKIEAPLVHITVYVKKQGQQKWESRLYLCRYQN